MKKNALLARTAVGAVGGMMLVGMAGVALAAEIPGEEENVQVNVEIAPVAPVGALTMSVASNATSLTEQANDAQGHRVFTGTLPTVTVSDDRSEVPANVSWYVIGQASAFTGAGSIGADRLGWTPALTTPAENGEVAEGGEVVPSTDAATLPGNNVGLVGEELLALALDSGEARTTGTWSANAALKLETDATQAPGAYSSTLTLTLWEDTY